MDKQDYFSGLATGRRRRELRVQSSVSAVCCGSQAAGAAGGGGEPKPNQQPTCK